MVPLVQGSTVFLYRDQYHQALNRCMIQPKSKTKRKGSAPPEKLQSLRDSTPAARYMYLLGVFFTLEELMWGTIDNTEETKYKVLNQTIVNAIKGTFTFGYQMCIICLIYNHVLTHIHTYTLYYQSVTTALHIIGQPYYARSRSRCVADQG